MEYKMIYVMEISLVITMYEVLVDGLNVATDNDCLR